MQTRTGRTLAAALLALTMFGGGMTAPALAVDDDVDVICWEFENGSGQLETECETVANLKAECALTDPDDESEMCQDVNPNRRAIGGLTTVRPEVEFGDLAADDGDTREGETPGRR